jgi:cysteine-rich repeat protein
MPSDYCDNGNGTDTVLFSEDLTKGTYYVIVTGEPGTSGPFTLTAELTAPTCGDGVVEPPEQCDPGSVEIAPNDGCGAPGAANQCQFLAAPVGEDKCPGQAVAVPVGMTVLGLAQGMSTYGFKDDYFGSCGGGTQLSTAKPGESDGTGGLDRVFQLTPAQSGMMTVNIGNDTNGMPICTENDNLAGCWSSVLYARTACDSATPELGCMVGAFAPASITFAVTANTPVWVFVDGFDNTNASYAPFNFMVNLQYGSLVVSAPARMPTPREPW